MSNFVFVVVLVVSFETFNMSLSSVVQNFFFGLKEDVFHLKSPGLVYISYLSFCLVYFLGRSRSVGLKSACFKNVFCLACGKDFFYCSFTGCNLSLLFFHVLLLGFIILYYSSMNNPFFGWFQESSFSSGDQLNPSRLHVIRLVCTLATILMSKRSSKSIIIYLCI